MFTKNKWSPILLLFGVVAIVLLVVKGNTPEKDLSLTDVKLDQIYTDLVTKQEKDELTADEIKEARNTVYKIDIDTYLEEDHPNLDDLWLYIQNVQLFNLNLPNREKMYPFLQSLWSDRGYYLHSSDDDQSNAESIDHLSPTKTVLQIYDAYDERSPFVSEIDNWLETVKKEFSDDQYVEIAEKMDELLHNDNDIAETQ